MRPPDLKAALARSLPKDLVGELVDNFTDLRTDVALGTLGRAAPGKFVESLVQVFQYIERGSFETEPSVDGYLKGLESRSSALPDGLRICGSRIARSMYTLRNKRNIAHKGEVDPNRFDLRFILAGAQWLLAELVRSSTKVTMEEAGLLVDRVQAPVTEVVEEIDGAHLVLKSLPVKKEILVLFHSQYPAHWSKEDLERSLCRRNASTIRKALKALWDDKLIEIDSSGSYRLTRTGYQAAAKLVAPMSTDALGG